MARKKSKKETPGPENKRGTSPPEGVKKRAGPNWPVLALSLAGVALAAYISFSAWFEAPAFFCGEGSSCDIVQQSRWGTFLGIPTAFLGLLTYLAIAFFACRGRDPGRQWKITWMISLAGVGYSVYLTAISLIVIGSTCAYCLASLALMTAILLTVSFQRPPQMPDFSWPSWAAQTLVVVGLLLGGMHLHYSGVFDSAAGPEDPYLKGLAIHLQDSGAKFYGAYW